MFYSVLPIYGLDAPIEYVQMDYDGIEVLAYKTPEGYQLERIFSTNPKDYLREDLAPGKLLQNALIKHVYQ